MVILTMPVGAVALALVGPIFAGLILKNVINDARNRSKASARQREQILARENWMVSTLLN